VTSDRDVVMAHDRRIGRNPDFRRSKSSIASMANIIVGNKAVAL
jgi:hypothetical protein